MGPAVRGVLQNATNELKGQLDTVKNTAKFIDTVENRSLMVAQLQLDLAKQKNTFKMQQLQGKDTPENRSLAFDEAKMSLARRQHQFRMDMLRREAEAAVSPAQFGSGATSAWGVGSKYSQQLPEVQGQIRRSQAMQQGI